MQVAIDSEVLKDLALPAMPEEAAAEAGGVGAGEELELDYDETADAPAAAPPQAKRNRIVLSQVTLLIDTTTLAQLNAMASVRNWGKATLGISPCCPMAAPEIGFWGRRGFPEVGNCLQTTKKKPNAHNIADLAPFFTLK